jgi:putative DNA base modification enzyme with NMAD domain
MAAFLANVGVNAAHRIHSPLFADGSFELRPIPEKDSWAPPMLQVPGLWGERAVHVDPDLAGDPPTYGDNCRTAGRAFSLRQARPGDAICFLARLQTEPMPGPAGFFLVGILEVAEVRADITADPGPGWWDANAHLRRGRAAAVWNSFWVFRGGAGSRLLPRAVPFAREEAEAALGPAIGWPEHRSELQTIGSHTRAVRRLVGPAEAFVRDLCHCRF